MANVNVTFEEMTGAANNLRRGQEQLESDLTNLQVMIQGLVQSGFVTDAASISFNETYQKFTDGSKTTIGALQGLAMFLDKAAQAMQETDQSLSNAIKSS